MKLTRESILAVAQTCNAPTGDAVLDRLFADYASAGFSTPDDVPIYYRFLYWLSQANPGMTMIELGARRGAASLHFLKGGGRAAVGIDLTNICDRRRFAGFQYRAINGDSTSPEAFGAVAALGKPDIVFIDTDHSYETTHREHETWRPHVKPGGLMLFDDICAPEYGCSRFWNELKGEKLALLELHPPTWGFGVLFC